MSADLSRWLGKVTCGDCLEVLRELPDCSVDSVITDPPYGISGDDGKTSRAKYGNPLRTFVYGEWDIAPELSAVLDEMARVLKPSGIVYVFCGGEQLSHLLSWMRSIGCSTRTLAWVKKAPTVANGQHLWLPAVETIAYGRRPHGTHNAHCAPGVWWEQPPRGAARVHPTQKPESIVRDFIAASTNEGGIVLDPFGGSGTTAVAAVQEGREFIIIEQDPAYCEIARARIADAIRNHQPTLQEVAT